MAKTPKSNPTKRAAPPPTTLGGRQTRAVAIRVGIAALALGGAALLWVSPWSPAPAQIKREVALAPSAPPKPSPTPAPAPLVEPAPPKAEPAAMTAAQRAAFDSWLLGAYKQCWSAPKTIPEGETYLPKIRIAYKADGSLAGAPRLVNPPSDPAWRAHADAAVRAVKSCDPLHIPEKFAAYYPQWKTKTVYFDPSQP